MAKSIMVPIKLLLGRLDKLEDRLADAPETLKAADDSPVRFEIMRESFRRGYPGPDRRFMNFMPPIMKGMMKSLNPLKKNPPSPKTAIDDSALEELESYLLGIGASSVGFTEVPARFVFQNKAIMHKNAIVLSMEMDKEGFENAPSYECEKTAMEIYRDLGIIANKAAEWLRARGFSAHAGHPLMGVALYPPLSQLGGLGWMGKNGMLITPEHGPRVRCLYLGVSFQ